MGGYGDVYGRWQREPAGFWAEIAERITWERPQSTILDSSQAPIYRWFSDGRLNTCFNAVDRHADGGRGDQPALIYDSPVTGSGRTFTYRELQDATARVAGAIARLGVGRGDRVVIYMPMVPEAVITMLACARPGAVHPRGVGGGVGAAAGPRARRRQADP